MVTLVIPDVKIAVGLAPDDVDGLVRFGVDAATLDRVIPHVLQTLADLIHVIRRYLDHEPVLDYAGLGREAARALQRPVKHYEARPRDYNEHHPSGNSKTNSSRQPFLGLFWMLIAWVLYELFSPLPRTSWMQTRCESAFGLKHAPNARM